MLHSEVRFETRQTLSEPNVFAALAPFAERELGLNAIDRPHRSSATVDWRDRIFGSVHFQRRPLLAAVLRHTKLSQGIA